MRLTRVQGVVFAAACALAGAAGCASSTANRTDKNYKVVCADSAPTGSNISRLKCWRERDVAERTAKDRATMEKLHYDTPRRTREDGKGNTNPARGQYGPQQLVRPAVTL